MSNFKAWKCYLTLHRRGEYDAAMAAYRAAHQKGFTAVTPLAAFGVLLLKSGDFDTALTIFDGMLKRSIPKTQRRLAVINRALVWWKLGRQDEAVEALYKMRKEYPSRIAHGCLCYVLFATGRLEEAREATIEAMDYCDDAVFFDTMGQICFVENQWPEAAEYFAKALKIQSTADSLYHLAVIRYDGGQKEEALDLMEQALEQSFSALATISREQVQDKLAEWEA